MAVAEDRRLLKVSRREVERLRRELLQQAELIAQDVPALDQAHRRALVREIADELLDGLERLLEQGLGRTRLRRAVTDMLWEFYDRYERRIGLEVVRAEYHRRLARTLRQYAEGRIDRETAERRLDRLVDQYHRAAYRLGRTHDGRERRPGVNHGRSRALRELNKQRLRDFLDRIDHRVATGQRWDSYVAWRAALYPGGLSAAYWWGWLETLPEDADVYWIMDPLAEHCRDCPQLEAGSPYRPGTIPTVPGNGDTECLTNCRCRLEARTGGRRR